MSLTTRRGWLAQFGALVVAALVPAHLRAAPPRRRYVHCTSDAGVERALDDLRDGDVFVLAKDARFVMRNRFVPPDTYVAVIGAEAWADRIERPQA